MEQQTMVDGQELWVQEHQLWVEERDLIVRNSSCGIRNMSWGFRNLNLWPGTGVTGSVTWCKGREKHFMIKEHKLIVQEHELMVPLANGCQEFQLAGKQHNARISWWVTAAADSVTLPWVSNCNTGLVSRTPVPGKLSEVFSYRKCPQKRYRNAFKG